MRGPEVADFGRVVHVESAAISPNGASVAVVVAGLDLAADRVIRRIAVVDRDSGAVAWAPGIGHSPAWSPDSAALAFVRGASELAVLASGDDKVRVLTGDLRGLATPRWSPRGDVVAVLAFGPASPDAEPIPDGHGRDGVVDSDTGWTRKVWTVDVSTGQATQRTASGFDDGGATVDLVWSPDGRAMIFAADRTGAWRHHYETGALHRVDLETGLVDLLTPATGRAARPVFSPDGRTLAYVGSECADSPPLANTSLWVLDLATGERRVVHDGAERPAGFTHRGELDAPAWLAGGALACIVSDGPTTHAWRFADGQAGPLTEGRRVVAGLSADRAGRRLAFLSAAPASPRAVHVLEGDDERTLFDPNRGWAAEVALRPSTRRRIERAGLPIDMWVLKPAGDGPHPVILDTHGLTGCFADDFCLDHQVWAAAGYAVVSANPRGSYGGSEAVLNGSLQDFGGEDAADVLAALDHVLAAEPGLDADRVGVTGYSYGGYLTNRLLTLTGRFRAAAAGGGPTHLVSWLGTSDLSEWFLAVYLPAPLSANATWYLDRSPLFGAGRISTPLLLYHGAADTRVPVAQAEELYRELRRCGRDVALRVVPDEAHSMAPRIGVGTGRPSRQLALREAILEWFDDRLGAREARVACALADRGLSPREGGLRTIADTLAATRRGLDAVRVELPSD